MKNIHKKNQKCKLYYNDKFLLLNICNFNFRRGFAGVSGNGGQINSENKITNATKKSFKLIEKTPAASFQVLR